MAYTVRKHWSFTKREYLYSGNILIYLIQWTNGFGIKNYLGSLFMVHGNFIA